MNPWLEMILRLLLATALGAGIGYQRERAHKAAGVRTHTLISLGAALFTVASIFRGPAGEEVAGLTTAATIWITAAIGLAAGAGLYLISAVATAITVGILMIPKIRG